MFEDVPVDGPPVLFPHGNTLTMDLAARHRKLKLSATRTRTEPPDGARQANGRSHSHARARSLAKSGNLYKGMQIARPALQ
jgi:hypothetical protein